MMLSFLIGSAFIIWTVGVLVLSGDAVRRFIAFYALLAAIAVMFSPTIHVPPGSWGVISLALYAFVELGNWLNAWALRNGAKP
jgi:hypothetical protein